MATINSPRAKRVVNLAVNEDGTWKIISDLQPGEVKTRLELAQKSVGEVLDRLAAGEKADDEDDDADTDENA
jgi:hypothetical protein